MENKVFVLENVRITILGLCHNHPLAGHFGVHKTLDLVKHILVAGPGIHLQKVRELLCNLYPEQEC